MVIDKRYVWERESVMGVFKFRVKCYFYYMKLGIFLSYCLFFFWENEEKLNKVVMYVIYFM